MDKTYSRINWQNEPNITTPLNEVNLNKMDYSLDEIDNRVIELDTSKANQSDLLLCIKTITYDTASGIFTFTWQNGTTMQVDLNIEKIPVSFSMSESGVITMTTTDGTEYTCDVASLIKAYLFEDSNQIDFTVTTNEEGSYVVTGTIKSGSITEELLDPNLLSSIRLSEANAQASAQTATNKALEASTSASEAATSAVNAKASEDKAKAYMEEAKQTDVSTLATEVDEIDNGLNSLFRYYEGVDLTQKFASEIANYSDEWAWIKARIQAGNFKGIYVCDYIPITCSNGYVLNAQVAGINTYKGYGIQQVGNHIDFICKELWNDRHVINKVDYNNGNANSPSPFLASDLNYWLNSMSGNVPNSASDPSVTTEVDYTTSGVLYYLPDKLKNQIITKGILLPKRYTAGKVLTNDNSWAWQSTGKLWIPSEVEVYGAPCWGDSRFGMGGFVQYPIFANNMNRAKLRCASKDRFSWWLLSAHAGTSTHFTCVTINVNCDNTNTTNAQVASPVCFRIG